MRSALLLRPALPAAGKPDDAAEEQRRDGKPAENLSRVGRPGEGDDDPGQDDGGQGRGRDDDVFHVVSLLFVCRLHCCQYTRPGRPVPSIYLTFPLRFLHRCKVGAEGAEKLLGKAETGATKGRCFMVHYRKDNFGEG